METNQNPSRLVIPSHLSAERSVQNWIQQNQLDRVKDASGMEWRIHVDMREVPDSVDQRRSIIELTVRVETSADVGSLLKTGTLTQPSDERLIGLLGTVSIPFARKPRYHEAKSMEEARHWLADRMIEIGDEMRSSAFHDVKRSLVGKWIDAKGEFGREYLTQKNQNVTPNTLTQNGNLK